MDMGEAAGGGGRGGGETIQSKDFKNESLKWKKNIMH